VLVSEESLLTSSRSNFYPENGSKLFIRNVANNLPNGSEISPTRCNNCVFSSAMAYLWPYTAYILLMMGEIVTRNM